MSAIAVDPQSSAVDQLQPVTLAELNAAAALQTRVDRKYLIDRADLEGLLVELGASARVLEIEGRRSLGYESTYYDTPEHRCYLDAVRSRPSRFKVRTRTYLDTNTHVVEVKTRSRSRHTVKTRCEGTPHDHHSLDQTSQAYVADTVHRELSGRAGLIAEAEVPQLVPSLRTSYQRMTLLISDAEADAESGERLTRATIDTALVFAAPDGPSLFYPQVVVVETKTAGPPSPVDRLLWTAGQRPVKISKYGTGMALLHPELPAAKWNRVLRHKFGWHRCAATE